MPTCGRCRATAKKLDQRETAVKKSYQMDAPHASVEIELPEQLTIGLSGIAASAKEGLLALAVGTGLQVMEAMFAEDVQRLCGPKGKHNEAPCGLPSRQPGGLRRPRRPAPGRGAPAGTLGRRPRRACPAKLRALLLCRGASPPGHGAHAGRPLDATLRRGPRTGRRGGEQGSQGHKPLGGLAALRGRHRERPGGAARTAAC